MSKEDIPELIHAGVVLALIIGTLLLTIVGLNEGWL